MNVTTNESFEELVLSSIRKYHNVDIPKEEILDVQVLGSAVEVTTVSSGTFTLYISLTA